MRKSIWISSLVVIVLLIGFVWYYYSYIYIPIPKGALTNVTELYDKFTPYMKDYVNEHLGYIDCEPKYYYYTTIDNISSVCFVCKIGDACFGYGEVNYGPMGLKMNPYRIWLRNIRTNNSKVIDFYENSLGTKLNCKYINKGYFSCVYNSKIYISDGMVTIKLLDDSKFENISKVICGVYNRNNTICENNLCKCGDLLIRMESGGIIRYGFA